MSLELELALGYLKTLFPALTIFFEQELVKTGGKVFQNAMSTIGGRFYELLKNSFVNQDLLDSARKDPLNEEVKVTLEQEIKRMIDQDLGKIQEEIVNLGKQEGIDLPTNGGQTIINHASNKGAIIQNHTGPLVINNRD
ncbi:MAG: hypothetical protein D3909_00790 [Candidatus Electrothrix sp. ATG1]|nr:hypothetical protein [Candidatus Electrothrix sp. ATG1]